MFRKLLICLTQPAKIGMYIFEKLRNSIIMLFFLILIAIIPFGLLMVFNANELSSTAVEAIEHTFMNSGLDHPLNIKDGVLSGEKGVSIVSGEMFVFINPNEEKNPYEMYSSGIPLVEFKADRIDGSISGFEVFSFTYEEAGLVDFDFNAIMNIDYLMMHDLIDFLNGLYKHFLPAVVTINTIGIYIQMCALVFASAALLALFAKMFNHFLPYRLRFKLALDSQVITCFAILLSFLFNAYFVVTIGLFVGSMYLLRSLRSIVKVEVKQVKKDGEE